MIVCTACNAENLDGKTACHHCGAALPAPTTLDCVVCAAPVKIGAKFCKRCGSAQPEPKSARPTQEQPVRTSASRQARADEDDSEKTVILTPQAREAMMAQAKAGAQRNQVSPPPVAAAEPPAGLFAPPSAPAVKPVESRPEPPPAAPSMRDQIAAQAPTPKFNYVAIGLGAGAFSVAALVSALLLMSGHTTDQPPVTIGDVSPPIADTSAPVETAQLPSTSSAPAEAPVASTGVADSAPVAVLPPPPVVAPVTAPVQAAKAPPAEAPAKKPKASAPHNDNAAAKRKQAEEALQRLLNQ